MSANVIAFEGNLAAQPDLTTTPNTGTTIAEGVVMVNRRRQNSAGDWIDAPPTRHRIKAFGRLAQHLAKLPTGSHVLIIGTVTTGTWTDRDTGQARYADTIVVDSAGLSLKFAPAPAADTVR